jgi:hypothetical protein
MTSTERDYDAILRRALSAAAESVEPAADGLDRIRGRLSAPRVSSFVLLTEFLHWFGPLLLWIESGIAGARSGLEALAARMQLGDRAGQVSDRIWPAVAVLQRLAARARPLLAALGWKAAPRRPRAAHRSQPPANGLRARLSPAFTRLGPAASWLRPVLAVAGAVAIVVAGVFALSQAQQFITPTNQITGPGATHHKSSPATTPPALVPIGSQGSPTSTGYSSQGAQPVVNCSPSPKAKSTTVAPASSPAATPSQSVTPTPTPTDSTATPTASPTDTGGLSTGGSGVAAVAAVAAQQLPVPCSSASAKAS